MRKTAMSLFASACLFLLLCCGAAARADVIINEVMASNGYYENGHAWDWVELYNNGDSTENLSGWWMSKERRRPLILRR